MTQNQNDTNDSALSRRRLLGAAGLTAVGIATAATMGTTAHAEEGDPNTDAAGNPLGTDDSEFVALAVPALTAGYSYFTGSQFDFHSNSSSSGEIRAITGSGVSAVNSYVVCALQLAAGTRVREVTIFAENTALTPATMSLRSYNLDAAGFSVADVAVTIPAGTALTSPVTVPCDVTIDAAKSYDLEMFSGGPTKKVYSFRIGMQPAAAFVPITPYRAYDSRLAGVPSPGILARLTNRVVSVVNAIGSSGAIVAPNVIPSTARAVTYNLTATGTTGDNFLAVAPGLAASTTVSAINFSANQTLANAATVSLDNGTVKVFCGDNVGSSHFIIDITGYYI